MPKGQRSGFKNYFHGNNGIIKIKSIGVCCLLVLVNLGLILITLGFSIVLQLFEPAFVWYNYSIIIAMATN